MTRARSILALEIILLAASAGCAEPQGGDAVVEVQGKVVYGADDRRDPFAYADQVWAARAVEFTAALVATSQIDATDPNNIHIGNRTPVKSMRFRCQRHGCGSSETRLYNAHSMGEAEMFLAGDPLPDGRQVR